MKKGFFITLEGCEGCGKSTQSLLLYEHIRKNGYETILTREPGGTCLAEAVRGILLNPENRISALAELLLYEASRAQHVAERILPALQRGCVVVCDRFTDATLAYQGYGRGLDTDVIERLNAIAARGLTPDITLFLDIPVKKGLERARGLCKDFVTAGDRLEREALSFHRKVRKGYLALAAGEPRRVKTVNAAQTIDEIHAAIASLVEKAIKTSKTKLQKVKYSHVV